MLTVVYKNTRMLWVFTTSSKRSLVHIICFIQKILNNKQHPCKHVTVDNDGGLVKSIYVTHFIVDEFSITIENTGGGSSRLNRKNERYNRSIHTMVIADFFDINQHKSNCCCDIYKIHSELENTSNQFACYEKKPSIYDLKTDVIYMPQLPTLKSSMKVRKKDLSCFTPTSEIQ